MCLASVKSSYGGPWIQKIGWLFFGIFKPGFLIFLNAERIRFFLALQIQRTEHMKTLLSVLHYALNGSTDVIATNCPLTVQNLFAKCLGLDFLELFFFLKKIIKRSMETNRNFFHKFDCVRSGQKRGSRVSPCVSCIFFLDGSLLSEAASKRHSWVKAY